MFFQPKLNNKAVFLSPTLLFKRTIIIVECFDSSKNGHRVRFEIRVQMETSELYVMLALPLVTTRLDKIRKCSLRGEHIGVTINEVIKRGTVNKDKIFEEAINLWINYGMSDVLDEDKL